MAASIFAILDDIAALMDDVSVAAKVATQKTAGILGDDLAVNAEKATGFLSSREIPVLWKITKGSFLNKAIIIPIIFLLQWIFPSVISYILIIGGFYLAYEGVEKIIHSITHKPTQQNRVKVVEKLTQSQLMDQENKKVKAAVLTDFILSIEIVIIALSTVMDQPLEIQIITVALVSVLATIGVYGIVALIVRMDDAGFKILRRSHNVGIRAAIGKTLVRALPVVIKTLAIVGTIALLLVSGGIFAHNVPQLHDVFHNWPGILREVTFALIGGLAVFILIQGISLLKGKKTNNSPAVD